MSKFYKIILPVLLCILFSQSYIFSQTRDLGFYVDNAVKSNQTINENKKLITTFDIRKELVFSSLKKPHIFGTANYLFAPTFEDIGYDSAITNGGLYSALINLELPLFNSFVSDARLEDLSNEQKGFENNIITTHHELVKNITDQYIKVYQDQEQIDAANEVLKLLDLQREVVKKLADRGIGKISDLNLLDIEYQTQVINKKQFEVAFETDLMDLNLSAGIRDSAMVELENPNLKLTEPNFRNSYFLESYILDSIKLSTEKKINEIN